MDKPTSQDLGQPDKDVSTLADRLMAEKLARQQVEATLLETERLLEQRTQELARTREELNDFAYVVSHDLKAPFRGISSLAEWLLADYMAVLDQDGQEMLTLMQGRVMRIARLIDGILQYSRVNRIMTEAVSVDLNTRIPEIAETLKPPSHIQIELAPNLPIIQGEYAKISQVFEHLLDNAIKAIQKPKGHITVNFQARDHLWLFEIGDNGVGIDPHHHERIFRVFQTLQARDQVESVGIGLSVTKKIVEFYGGEIWLESELGKGSTFSFTWPKSACS